MSYGNGKSAETHDFRALPLAVGAISLAKKGQIAILRDKTLATLCHMGNVAHCPDPLIGTVSGQELTEILIVEQAVVAGLNKAYAERCRLAVTAAVSEQNKRYFKQLIGRLRHASSEIPEADRKADSTGFIRQYYYVPPGCTISIEELAKLCVLGAKPFADVKKLFHQVIIDNNITGLTSGQERVIREIHRQVLAKHGQAQFGAKTTTVALPLDYRVLRSTDKNIVKRIDGELDTLILTDKSNAKYKFFLDIASPVPLGERIRLPLQVPKRVMNHLLRKGKKTFTANSLTLELGPNGAIGVRLVITQPKAEMIPISDVRHILARDFGYKNTIALSIIKLDSKIDEEKLAEIQQFTKNQTKKFLETHAMESELNVVERYLFDGKDFLAAINGHAVKIDALRSRIDLEYLALPKPKMVLCEALRLLPGADGFLPKITPRCAPRGHPQFQAVQDFLGKIALINDLKIRQRALYKKVSKLKKCWFGYLSNIEAALAQKYEALVIRENLTIVTEERESLTYKGRSFNKMINNGSHGRYELMATEKLIWNGVPEKKLPSFYTSSSCFRHGIVDKKQRRGDRFTCLRCREEGRKHEHADSHAADTLGAYLLLRPIKYVTNISKVSTALGSTVL